MSVFEEWTRNIKIAVRCAARAFRTGVNMALLTEGWSALQRVYKHGPPDGGPNHESSTYVKRCACHASHF